MKIASTLFATCFVIQGLFAQQPPDAGHYKRVPVLLYSPYSFLNTLEDSFKCTETQDYYLVSETESYSHNAQYGTYFTGQYQERKTRRNDNIYNLNKFRDIIMANDSCFFISFEPIQIFNNRILGIKQNGTLRFTDEHGGEFGSLEELAIHLSGGGGLDSFFDQCLENYRRYLYGRGSDNGFYVVGSKAEAIDILREDYYFESLRKGADAEEAVNIFIETAGRLIEIDREQREALSRAISAAISGSPSVSFDDFFEVYAKSSASCDFIPLQTVNISQALSAVLGEEQYAKLSKKLCICKSKTLNAYSFMRKEIRRDEQSRGIVVLNYSHENT